MPSCGPKAPSADNFMTTALRAKADIVSAAFVAEKSFNGHNATMRLAPAIHVFLFRRHWKDVEARDKPGHDGEATRDRASRHPGYGSRSGQLEVAWSGI